MATTNAGLARNAKPPFRSAAFPRRSVTAIAFLLALLGILLSPRIAPAAGVREERPNLVGGEVLGRGLILTVNYERFLNNQFGLGAGAMVVGTSDGLVAVVPLYASFLTGNTHSLYLGAGTTFLSEGGSIEDYEHAWLLQASVGYHYHSASGFFVRPLFTFNQEAGGGEFLIWPGVTIGGSF